jgi:hypothetical protein
MSSSRAFNGNVMGSELEAVENESAWEPQEYQEPSTEEQPASYDQLSSMTENELADYVGKSIKNALETRIPGVDKQVTRRRKKKGPIVVDNHARPQPQEKGFRVQLM